MWTLLQCKESPSYTISVSTHSVAPYMRQQESLDSTVFELCIVAEVGGSLKERRWQWQESDACSFHQEAEAEEASMTPQKGGIDQDKEPGQAY